METINMRQEELQELVEAVSLQHFNRAFQHEARFNSRLRTTGGRYLLSSHDLEFNPKQLAWHGKEELIRIIKHELCHYHLHLQGKGYHHRDPEFKQLLKRVGGSRYCSNIPGTRNRETVKHCYECKSCGHRYYRRRRMNTDRYVCGGCKGRLRKIQLKY